MKLSSNILYFLLLCIANSLYAQNNESFSISNDTITPIYQHRNTASLSNAINNKLLISSFHPIQKKVFAYKPIVSSDSSHVLLKKHNSREYYTLEFFDKNMKSNGSKAFYLNGKNQTLLDIACFQNNYVMLIEDYDKNTNTYKLLGNISTSKELKHLKPYEIVSISSPKVKQISTQTHRSENGKLLLVSCLYNTEEGMKLNYYVLDENLKQQDFAEISLKTQKDQFHLLNIGITNQGDIHLISKRTEDSNPKYHFISLFRDNGEMIEQELNFNDEQVKSIDLLIHQNQASAIALLGQKRQLTQLYFIQTNNINKQYSQPITHPLALTLSQSSHGLSPNYQLINITQNQQSIFITFEYNQINRYTTFDSFGNPHTSVNYIFDDVAIIALDQQGNKKWDKIIPKQQTSINDHGYGLGIGIFTSPQGISVAFNSNQKNTQAGELHRSNNIRRSNLVNYTYSNNGELSYQILHYNRDTNLIFFPRYGLYTKLGLYLSGRSGKSEATGLILAK